MHFNVWQYYGSCLFPASPWGLLMGHDSSCSLAMMLCDGKTSSRSLLDHFGWLASYSPIWSGWWNVVGFIKRGFCLKPNKKQVLIKLPWMRQWKLAEIIRPGFALTYLDVQVLAHRWLVFNVSGRPAARVSYLVDLYQLSACSWLSTSTENDVVTDRFMT